MILCGLREIKKKNSPSRMIREKHGLFHDPFWVTAQGKSPAALCVYINFIA
jgi:hypothetical protein